MDTRRVLVTGAAGQTGQHIFRKVSYVVTNAWITHQLVVDI